jgi:hypothetical protein
MSGFTPERIHQIVVKAASMPAEKPQVLKAPKSTAQSFQLPKTGRGSALSVSAAAREMSSEYPRR